MGYKEIIGAIDKINEDSVVVNGCKIMYHSFLIKVNDLFAATCYYMQEKKYYIVVKGPIIHTNSLIRQLKIYGIFSYVRDPTRIIDMVREDPHMVYYMNEHSAIYYSKLYDVDTPKENIETGNIARRIFDNMDVYKVKMKKIDGFNHPDFIYVDGTYYLKDHYEDEKYINTFIMNAIDQRNSKIIMDDDHLTSLFYHRFSVVYGPARSGKTTLTKDMFFDELRMHYFSAKDIPNDVTFNKEYVIIDDFSMMTHKDFVRILKYNSNSSFVIIGDPCFPQCNDFKPLFASILQMNDVNKIYLEDHMSENVKYMVDCIIFDVGLNVLKLKNVKMIDKVPEHLNSDETVVKLGSKMMYNERFENLYIFVDEDEYIGKYVNKRHFYHLFTRANKNVTLVGNIIDFDYILNR